MELRQLRYFLSVAETEHLTQSADALFVTQSTLSAGIRELESLVGTMEDGSLPLETSLAAYRRGVALVRICQERLADVEGQVKVLEADLLRPLGADEA